MPGSIFIGKRTYRNLLNNPNGRSEISPASQSTAFSAVRVDQSGFDRILTQKKVL